MLKKFKKFEQSQANQHKCSKKSCDKQADIFIQGADPDLSLNIPFCREHADDYKIKMMFASYGEISVDDIEKWLNENLNEYNYTRQNVGKFEENRQRQEIIDHMVKIIRRGSLEQLKSWKEILGW